MCREVEKLVMAERNEGRLEEKNQFCPRNHGELVYLCR